MPPVRELGWDLEPLDSADTACLRRPSHLALTIEHDVVRGVTPAMLAWWSPGAWRQVTRLGSARRSSASNWLRHDVEEVGNLERSLPALYADQTRR